MYVCVLGMGDEYSVTQTGSQYGNVIKKDPLPFEYLVGPLAQPGQEGVGQVRMISLNTSRRISNA